MLLFSIVGSLVLVVYTYTEFKNRRFFNYDHLILAGLAVIFSPCFFLPGLIVHGLLALIGVMVWKKRQWSAVSLRRYLIGAGVASYALIAGFALQEVLEQHRLQQEYTFESMEDRVPAPRKISVVLAPDTKKRLAEMNESLVWKSTGSHREYALRRLHQSSVQTFVASPGFGVARGPGLADWNDVVLDDDLLAQPGAPFASTVGPADFASEPLDVKRDSLLQMHMSGILDFVNPKGFGVIETRQKVLGFRPHRFSNVPTAAPLTIRAIELVSLLMNGEPVVYMSDNLPSMKEARTAPKRPLNAFESAGLEKLYAGDELFLRETTEGLRMLGAVRSVEQCVKCHGGERGDLLGAFSYSLTRLP